MERLNREFGGQLDMAIDIFKDAYPRHFLHQLVSSQLDMDRLDYLGRDSFFTGVSEGIVGTERIINMLNVKDDKLVIDEKGIYSIEKFIISRRLMYWQVYLHKTVIAADNVFYAILRRARLLLESRQLPGNEQFLYFLKHKVSEADFRNDAAILDRFAMIDDNDVISTVKSWILCDDQVLSTLCGELVGRRLPAIRVSQQPFDDSTVDGFRKRTSALYSFADQTLADFFVGTGQLVNHAYSFDDSEIRVLFKSGECMGISEASDQLDRHFLEKTVTKYFLYFPKDLK